MAGKTNKTTDARYSKYKAESTWRTNRLKKLARALKRDPNNSVQIKAAMSNVTYRRKNPVTSIWSKTNIAIASMYKDICGICPPAIFSSNPAANAEAFLKLSKVSTSNAMKAAGKVLFSIGEQMKSKASV